MNLDLRSLTATLLGQRETEVSFDVGKCVKWRVNESVFQLRNDCATIDLMARCFIKDWSSVIPNKTYKVRNETAYESPQVGEKALRITNFNKTAPKTFENKIPSNFFIIKTETATRFPI